MKVKSIDVIKNGLIAGVFSFIISVLLNYYVLPFPESITGNVISHGTGGFFCGFFSAVIGILIYVSHYKRNTQK